MAIQVTCAAGHRLKVSPKRAGTVVRCPACQQEVAVPAAGSATPQLPEPVAPPVVAPTTFASTTRGPLHPRAIDPRHRTGVYYLAAGCAGLALLTMLPALWHLNLSEAPGWARLVLLVALLQLAYAAWLALTPDWSSLWVVMLALGAVAALYATGAAMTLQAEPGDPLLLGLGELCRQQGSKPTLWCAAVVLLASLLAQLTGAASSRWRRAALAG